MACSKYELGYEDNRFEIVVSQRFHCPICFLVLKDPVMCKNQHTYCSFCLKKHLENSSSCPTCLEHLTVDTLIEAPRLVKDYISELMIHCDYYPRGCSEMVQVVDLKRHVELCGFSPVQCTNESCNILVNMRDKLHHETETCDFRKLKCCDCSGLKVEVKELKDGLTTEVNDITEKVHGLKEVKEMKGEVKQIKVEVTEIKEEMKELKVEVKEMKDKMMGMEEKVKEMIEDEMKKIREVVKSEVAKVKEELKNEMRVMKEDLKDGAKEVVMNAVPNSALGKEGSEVELSTSQLLSEPTSSSNARENIIIAGGQSEVGMINTSTECFNWVTQTWTSLDYAESIGYSHCSILYQCQMVVIGGYVHCNERSDTLKCLNIEDPAAKWKDLDVTLPVQCSSHKSVCHYDHLYLSGGYVNSSVQGMGTCSNAIYEVQLIPPYSSRLLTSLTQPINNHGMEIFDQKLFILGGFCGGVIKDSVIQYDLLKNECKVMPPLSYAVGEMATVLWRNNVVVIGGHGKQAKCLNTVMMYDVTNGVSQILPQMKYRRRGCTAVLTGNVVVVMGGKNENRDYLRSVECFDLERQVWEDMPDMLEQRVYATAVVKPNH